MESLLLVVQRVLHRFQRDTTVTDHWWL